MKAASEGGTGRVSIATASVRDVEFIDLQRSRRKDIDTVPMNADASQLTFSAAIRKARTTGEQRRKKKKKKKKGRGPKYLPKQIGDRYTVLGTIGKGGMGYVLDVQDRQTYERCVAKLLLPDLAEDPDFVQRFHTEARIIRDLNHPNIVKLLDYGVDDSGALYMVMEKLVGMELSALIKHGTLHPKVVRGFSLDVLSALQAAHEAGVIHRDIKPDNIYIVDRPGMRPSARVIDFGIALEGDRFVDPDADEEIIGTPRYMSPEQLTGGGVDVRSDLYSLAIIQFLALSGDYPHKVTKGRQVIIDRLGPPRSLQELSEQALPRPLVHIIMKALASNPDDRWDSARQMRKALKAVRVDLV